MKPLIQRLETIMPSHKKSTDLSNWFKSIRTKFKTFQDVSSKQHLLKLNQKKKKKKHNKKYYLNTATSNGINHTANYINCNIKFYISLNLHYNDIQLVFKYTSYTSTSSPVFQIQGSIQTNEAILTFISESRI